MITAKVNGKKVKIETSYDELSFDKYLKLLSAKDDPAELISVLIDIPADTIRKAAMPGLENVIRAIQFMKTPAAIDEHPTKLGEWTLPEDITFETVGQYETMIRKTNEAVKMDDLIEQTKMLANYAAIYCQPLNGEEYDDEKAEWLVPKIMQMPCLEVMSAGNFFHAKCLSMQSGLSMSYLRKNIPMRKSRPGLKRLARRSGFTRLWTILRAMWDKMTKRS